MIVLVVSFKTKQNTIGRENRFSSFKAQRIHKSFEVFHFVLIIFFKSDDNGNKIIIILILC